MKDSPVRDVLRSIDERVDDSPKVSKLWLILSCPLVLHPGPPNILRPSQINKIQLANLEQVVSHFRSL